MPTNRRKFLLQGTLAATVVVATKPSAAVSKLSSWIDAETRIDNTIVLLHTNDIYGNIHAKEGIGGLENACQHISSIRKKKRNVVVVDAGNIFTGDKRKKQQLDDALSVMSTAGYDAMLPGVKDLKCGTDYLKSQLVKHRIAAVASNYNVLESELDEVIQPYHIIKKGRFKIGIIGAGRNLKDHNIHVPLQYRNVISSINSTATMLKETRGCHLVICLSQLGYKTKGRIDDVRLAAQSKNVDIIIGGYSCTFMQQPSIILNSVQSEVIVNHAGMHGKVLGNIEIEFTESGVKKGVRFVNHLIGARQEWRQLC